MDKIETSIEWFLDLDNELNMIENQVPYIEKNEHTIIPKLSGLIINAGSLLDSIFRNEYEHTSEKSENLNIKSFQQHFEPKLVLSLKTAIHLRNKPRLIQPFKNWTQSNKGRLDIPWWDSYNNIKHDRLENIENSTLSNAIQIMAATFLTIGNLQSYWKILIRKNLLTTGSYNFEAFLRSQNTTSKITGVAVSKQFALAIGDKQFDENFHNMNANKYSIDYHGNEFLRNYFSFP